MLFNSYIFVIFFAIFFPLYFLLRYRVNAQNVLLLIGSYIFYGWWDERFLVLLIVSTVNDYVISLGMVKEKISIRQGIGLSLFLFVGTVILSIPRWQESIWMIWPVSVYIVLGWVLYWQIDKIEEHPLRKKLFLIVSLCGSLGLLGVFKYFNFFADSFAHSMALLGWQVDKITLQVILPVGISFYTFQTMSYIIDVYRGLFTPRPYFLQFATFIAFFPQLVAGPIERANHMLPQFGQLRTLQWINIRTGLWLTIWGLYKKIVIADHLAPIVNKIFADPSAMGSGDLTAGILAFTFQIYCDFSGYSDMARGLARMLGFEIMLNFNIPYVARTPTEFWRRWHISLSSWLRDYLYISLGGNRGTSLLVYRNLMITMVLGGLWHGAAWNFVLWGFYQGLILIIYRLFRVDSWLAQRTGNIIIQKAQDVILIAVMFILVCFGWLLFRAPSPEVITTFMTHMGIGTSNHFYTIGFYLWPLFVFQGLQLSLKTMEPLEQLSWFFRFNIQLFVIYSLLFLSSKGGQQFIYFNF